MTILREGNHIDPSTMGRSGSQPPTLGGDKDEVIIRSDGAPGYFASDIAYHYNKFVERGFDRVIDVWGADHQGHVPRMKAMMKALGLDPERLTIILYQLVTLKRGGEVVRLSKRTGDIITLREVLEEVGADAVRYLPAVALRRQPDGLRPGPGQGAIRREPGVLHPVRPRAHRAASCAMPGNGQGVDCADGDVSLLTSEPELALIRQMLLPSGDGASWRPSTWRRTTWPTMRRTWQRPSTPSTATAASSPPSRRMRRSARRG